MKEKQVIFKNINNIKKRIINIYIIITLIVVVDRGYKEELEKEEMRSTSYDRYVFSISLY